MNGPKSHGASWQWVISLKTQGMSQIVWWLGLTLFSRSDVSLTLGALQYMLLSSSLHTILDILLSQPSGKSWWSVCWDGPARYCVVGSLVRITVKFGHRLQVLSVDIRRPTAMWPSATQMPDQTQPWNLEFVQVHLVVVVLSDLI